jgi:glycosyltransferase involved in cell wall biosynthesis
MPDQSQSVVCIIPAFNEGKTVATIARIARSVSIVNRVLVVDDGSSDDTSDKARSVDGVEVLRLTPNRGKGAAMKAGIEATSEPVILFLDADLIGLKSKHIVDLLNPVIDGSADMSVGLFRGGRLHTDLAHIITPSLSGQRGIRREVVANMDMATVGFGIERALTELWSSGKIKVKEVIWKGVTHRTKEEKRGYWEGVRQRIKMYLDILKFESSRLKKK